MPRDPGTPLIEVTVISLFLSPYIIINLLHYIRATSLVRGTDTEYFITGVMTADLQLGIMCV